MTDTASAPPSPMPRSRLRAPWRRLLAFAGWLLVALYFIFAALVLALRYWVLPDIGAYSQTIESAISRAIGERVTIGSLGARWQGLHPEIDLGDVRVHDEAGREALHLPSVEAVVGWRSVLLGSLSLRSLAIEQPDLAIRRDSSGRLFIAGLELKDTGGSGGAGDWLFGQREIVVRNARVTWLDERRAAPPLELSGFTFVLRNAGDSHRFGLRAQTSRELASALDIRGDLVGRSLQKPEEWRGLVYAELDYVDLAAWQRWVDYPLEVASGSGGLRAWLSFDANRITELTADVLLSGVRGRVASHLAPLDLSTLSGRLGYRDSPRGIEMQGRRLSLQTAGGVELPPADFALRWERAEAGRAGAAPQPARGDFQATSLNLAPLAGLAEHLPLPAELRTRLAETRPRGVVHDLRIQWAGEAVPPEKFSLRGRFDNLGVNRHRGFGGFEGLSGSVDATEAGGSARIASGSSLLDLPGVLAEDRLPLDSLTAQLAWTLRGGVIEVKFSGVSAANREMVLTGSGSFSTRSTHADSPGTLDLSAQIARVDGRVVSRYIPRLGKPALEYLKGAIVSGTASDVRIRVKGDLWDFPYADPKLGTFEVRGKLAGVDFQYAPDWPRITGFAGDLAFDGPRMTLTAARGAILGARIAGARASMPDFYHGNEQLLVEGQVDGPTPEFLRFIEASPVTRFIGGATRDMSATGNGRLALRLELPLQRIAETRVTGSYQLIANTVTVTRELPPLSQVNGRLEFSDNGVSARSINAQFLDGPVTLGLATRPDGAVTVNAQGATAMQPLARFLDLGAFGRAASGSASWRAGIVVRGQSADVTVESNLQGVALTLPEPFAKTAGEILPLRIDRGAVPDSEAGRRAKVARIPAGGDVITLSAGKLLSAAVVRRREADPRGERFVIDRGVIGVNEPAAAVDRPGLALSVTVPSLDVERWRALLGADGAAAMGLGSGGGSLASLALNVGELDFSGKRIHDLRLRANAAGGGWGATVSAREFAGTVTWRPEGRGRVLARLKHLTLPGDSPAGAAAPADATGDLPALDVIAESFATQARKLGRLELAAVHQGRDWKIDRLMLGLGEGTFSADGIWQSWAQRPSINLNVKLDVSDVGEFMTHFGYPGTMRGGTAKFEGKLGWVGSPQNIDYATLTGQIRLEANKGQFLKADPGVARLLGILSMQSWITLDFRNMFGEGFVYDSISCSATISKGVASTEDFAMRGKSAQVTMSGTVDLARETQALRVRVVPSLGDGVSSVAGLALANPVTGLGAMLLQRLLKDPLGQIFAFEYQVGGTWTEPKVERAAAEKPAAAAPSGPP